MIELLLIKDVEHLGKRGSRVRVREGYARNHLFPMGAAIPATPENQARVERQRVAWLADEARLIEDLRELAGHIGKLDLRIVMKASESGNLYGSVTDKAIAAAAAEAGIRFEPRAVRLDQPLKMVGDYTVPIHLHEQVSVSIPVRVRAEGREDWLPAAPAAEVKAAPGAST
jgi:large subunit ribosomal protein L9